MEHLFQAWGGIEKGLRTAYLFLFLDCDGTLAPIADTPDKARIPQKTKEALIALSRCAKLRLAIISGRSLSDIKAVVGLDGVIYAGSHGLEAEGPGVSHQWKIDQSAKDILARIRTRLTDECAALPGVFVEDKGLSLCLHYRMADIDEEKIRAVFDRITGPYKESGKITVIYGKKAMEVKPSGGLDKGGIVRWLLARERSPAREENIMAMYIGDDRTDEDAFNVLGDGGISVMVGKDRPSSAKYYVDDTDQVHQLLTMILKARGA